MYDVITLGEAMIRFSTIDHKRIEQSELFSACVGGAELNVAVGTSRLGLESAWISVLPNNHLGKLAINKISETGLDTSMIRFDNSGRMGQYFVEFGASPRRTKIEYDRGFSSFSMMQSQDFDFKKLLNTRLFHISGITPAISASCKEVTKKSIKAAKENGALVSFDINFRGKLWSEQEAQDYLTPLMNYIDILITTEEDTERVFKITGKDYKEVAIKLQNKFKFNVVVLTLRDNISVWKNNWTAIAYDGNEFYKDKEYEIELVDRFGGGDAFSAGFIYGYLTSKKDIDKSLKFGNALSSLKQTNHTDFSWISLDEVVNLLDQKTLRVER